MTTSDKRSEALDKALANLNKKYSAGTVMKLGDRKVTKVETFSTGSLTVDLATGIGGIPRGRITEIYGPESSGKTTLALHAIADAQKKGEAVAFIDVEHALDPVYAQNLGVNLDELIFSQPDTGEQALEIMEELINSSAIGLIVLDSVAALVPKSELEGDMGQSSVGVQARLMSQALRKITGSAQKNNCALLFINQLREKIGVMFGSPEVTTGGKALKFYASMRFDIRRIESLKEGTDIVGNRTRVKIVKNKMAPPFKQGESDIMYGKGFSREGDLITFGVDLNIIKKSGSWYTYQGDQLGQGKENVRQFLKDNSDIAEEIEAKITEILLPTENSNEEEDGTAEDVSPGK